MQAQAWTAIGLLAATLLGVLFYLDNRIGVLGSEVRGQFQAQGSRFDNLAARMDTLSVRVEEQGVQLVDRIYDLAARLDDHVRRHAI